MSELVLDASAALAWCFEDEVDDASRDLLEYVRRSDVFVPALFHLELANVINMAERRGRLPPASATEFTTLIEELPIRVDDTTRLRAFGKLRQLAADQALTVYDAAYADLAARLAVPLATRDVALKRAAGRLGIELVPA